MKYLKHAIYQSLVTCLRSAAFKQTGESVTLNGKPVLEGNLADLGRLCTVEYSFPQGFTKDIETVWNLSYDKVIKKGIVPLPTPLENRLISAILAKTFGDKLELCEGFRQVKEKGMFKPEWRFMLTTREYKQGIIVPLRENGLTVGLRIYRSVQDRNSFILERKIAA